MPFLKGIVISGEHTTPHGEVIICMDTVFINRYEFCFHISIVNRLFY